MLDFEKYQLLDETAKAAAIIEGDFLANREENGLTVQLYGLSNFYAELYYDPVANKILRWRAFQGTALLGPYLAHIRFNTR